MLANGSAWSSLLRTTSHGCGPMRGGWMLTFILGPSRSHSPCSCLLGPRFRGDDSFGADTLQLAFPDRRGAAGGIDRLLGEREIGDLLHGRLLVLGHIADLDAVV